MGDWKEIQSLCCIWTQNTCKLFFYGEPRVYNMDKNGLEKLDNNFQVKVKKLVE